MTSQRAANVGAQSQQCIERHGTIDYGKVFLLRGSSAKNDRFANHTGGQMKANGVFFIYLEKKRRPNLGEEYFHYVV